MTTNLQAVISNGTRPQVGHDSSLQHSFTNWPKVIVASGRYFPSLIGRRSAAIWLRASRSESSVTNPRTSARRTLLVVPSSCIAGSLQRATHVLRLLPFLNKHPD